MSAPPNPTDHIVRADLDPEFLETALTQLAWAYSDLYWEIEATAGLDNFQKQEEYQRRRGLCAVKTLLFACERHKVPFDRLRLDCNGQVKLLVRMGRVIIMQETIDAFGDPPKAADYKLKFASTSSAVQQLEFDFGDGRFRSREWSGCILAVLLHKPAGPNFTEAHKKLGGVSLAIPDAAYSHWTRRFDLHELAMYGRNGARWLEEERDTAPADQADKVTVGIKRKNSIRDTER
ncbi:hypothetical protein [Methylorubrum sp. SL192]|uniref:hypothetical protein n=1 Tax=Methylorubrum sp. SL192 TaxID=2995167 RepID=UPI0022769177|nr:hypothetical protein [Methylorubrum sp. SL192]MCY1644387.1 hypothetical protein [Methylorubrum sp. SL192]